MCKALLLKSLPVLSHFISQERYVNGLHFNGEENEA